MGLIMNTAQKQALDALDNVIRKSRIHLYKPIQIAEILYQNRVNSQLNLLDLESYRKQSKRWRDEICRKFLGRVSTSSARFQDNLFEPNAMPPEKLAILDEYNRANNGAIEAYIYQRFAERFSQMNSALNYCCKHQSDTFQLIDFLNLFWREAGLKRSIDKVYEIIVYALFDALVSELELTIGLYFPENRSELWREYQEFAEKVLPIVGNETMLPAKIYRVGVTNAADRGLDMWSNFGLAIQVKHLSLDEELAENIVESISADRIVIVCKQAEQSLIVSLLTQIGWRNKIQHIVTEDDLILWYEKALRGRFPIGKRLLSNLQTEIAREFPVINEDNEFDDFLHNRGYYELEINF